MISTLPTVDYFWHLPCGHGAGPFRFREGAERDEADPPLQDQGGRPMTTRRVVEAKNIRCEVRIEWDDDPDGWRDVLARMELLAQEVRDQQETWVNARAAAMAQPIENQEAKSCPHGDDPEKCVSCFESDTEPGGPRDLLPSDNLEADR